MQKTILFLTLCGLCLFSACSDPDPIDPRTSGVWVRFQNTTDADLKEAQMVFQQSTPAVQLGTIAANATSPYVQFDVFPVGAYDEALTYKFPDGSVKAKVNGADIVAWTGMWCGTGLLFDNLPEGEYTMVISKVSGENYYLEFQ